MPLSPLLTYQQPSLEFPNQPGIAKLTEFSQTVENTTFVKMKAQSSLFYHERECDARGKEGGFPITSPRRLEEETRGSETTGSVCPDFCESDE